MRCIQRLNRHFQILGRPECDFLAGLDLDCFAGCRVAPHASSALPNLQDAETGNADAFAFLEMLGDNADEIAEGGFTCSFRQLMLLGQDRRMPCATISLQRRSCRLVAHYRRISQSHWEQLREHHSGSILPVERSVKASFQKHTMSYRFVRPLFARATKFARVKHLSPETGTARSARKFGSFCVASGDSPNQEVRQILHRVKGLEPVSPNVPSATAENQYCDNDDQKIGGVHVVLLGPFATGSDTCHFHV